MSFLRSFIGALLLAAALVGSVVWYLNHQVSVGAESYLRKYVFTRPQTASFQKFHADLVRGFLSVEGLRFKRSWGEPSGWTFNSKRISIQIPIQELLSGAGSIKRLHLEGPVLEVVFSAETSDARNSGQSAISLPKWVQGFPIGEVQVSEGAIHLGSGGVTRKVEVSALEGAITRLVKEGRPEGPIRADFQGRILSEKPGDLFLDMTIQNPSSPFSFEGEIRIKNLSIPYVVSRLFPADPEVQVLDGSLDVKTQLTCKQDWLTASHLVEVKNLKIQVAEGRKKILGLKVKYLKDILNIDYLSFVIPMNGSIQDPHIGIASSIQQILYKVLEDKMEKEDLESFAQKGGAYLGGKVDGALKDWLKQKRKD
ncbi:MAG: hypothetical protein HY400_01605 [Elusimicrobia bacterium]|nr:hypothetical protein [Elusimicrobiota bacterium]